MARGRSTDRGLLRSERSPCPLPVVLELLVLPLTGLVVTLAVATFEGTHGGRGRGVRSRGRRATQTPLLVLSVSTSTDLLHPVWPRTVQLPLSNERRTFLAAKKGVRTSLAIVPFHSCGRQS